MEESLLVKVLTFALVTSNIKEKDWDGMIKDGFFSLDERQKALKAFSEETFDLVIVGGGINGAGVAWEATRRGLRVALVEASDFASGTSSRSSKLIHGGIRYLENLEFSLVFEALKERSFLLKMYPHLVTSLKFLIPLFKTSRVSFFKMRLGMWLYDVLALFRAPQCHKKLKAKEIFKKYPLLRSQDLVGGFSYFDASMDDDRLVLETFRLAQRTGLLKAASYVEALGVELDSQGLVTGIQIQDKKNPESPSVTLRGRSFLNAVGPWTDIWRNRVYDQSLNLSPNLDQSPTPTQSPKRHINPQSQPQSLQLEQQPQSYKKVLRPTKGVHVTLPQEKLPLSTAVVMGVEDRIVFAIPRDGVVLVGTTDTDYVGNPRDVRVEPQDVNYLLGVLKSYFPLVKVGPLDIIGSYAGVRPLVQDGARTEGQTSREHSIWTEPNGMTYVTGGKYTTYRIIAQQVVDHLFQVSSLVTKDKASLSAEKSFCIIEFLWKTAFFGKKSSPWKNKSPSGKESEDSRDSKDSTGSLESVESLSQRLREKNSQLSEEEAQLLVKRFGLESVFLVEQWDSGYSYREYEALFAIYFTCCFTLKDFFFRRVPWVLTEKDSGLRFLEEIASVWKRSLNLSESEFLFQKEELLKQINFEQEWKKSFPRLTDENDPA
jgi:glycerol-3-phosphate dehydrogenase